jgi:Ni/Fe-hydrogenase 1 B-type cytochrome subunit
MSSEAVTSEVGGGVRDPRAVRVYVWDLVVRSTHWLIALSLLVLSVTGIYIGNPSLIAPGPATGHFIMGTMKAVHFYGAIVFTLSVLARIWWALVRKGTPNWRSFIPVSKSRRNKLVGTFLFYIFLRDRPPAARGHNPLAGITYVAVFGLYLVMIATGLGLQAIGTDSLMHHFDVLLPVFGGAQGARWIHHVVMWLLIGFFVHHMFSALLMSVAEKNGTIDSIFSGYKWLDPNELDPEERAAEDER